MMVAVRILLTVVRRMEYINIAVFLLITAVPLRDVLVATNTNYGNGFSLMNSGCHKET